MRTYSNSYSIVTYLRFCEPIGDDTFENDRASGLHIDLGVARDFHGRNWRKRDEIMSFGQVIQLAA